MALIGLSLIIFNGLKSVVTVFVVPTELSHLTHIIEP